MKKTIFKNTTTFNTENFNKTGYRKMIYELLEDYLKEKSEIYYVPALSSIEDSIIIFEYGTIVYDDSTAVDTIILNIIDNKSNNFEILTYDIHAKTMEIKFRYIGETIKINNSRYELELLEIKNVFDDNLKQIQLNAIDNDNIIKLLSVSIQKE